MDKRMMAAMVNGKKIRFEVMEHNGAVVPLIYDMETGRLYPQDAPEVEDKAELLWRIGELEAKLKWMVPVLVGVVTGYVSLWMFSLLGMI